MSGKKNKCSPTHTYPDHQPSIISFLHLLRSMASSLFNLHAWQSFSHNHSPSPLWSTSTSYSIHFFSCTAICQQLQVFFSIYKKVVTYVDEVPDVNTSILRARHDMSVSAADDTVYTILTVYMTGVSVHNTYLYYYGVWHYLNWGCTTICAFEHTELFSAAT